MYNVYIMMDLEQGDAMDTRTECNWNGSAEIYEVEQVAFPRED